VLGLCLVINGDTPVARIALSSEEDRATAQVSRSKNFVKLDVLFLRYASGQTDRQT